MHVLKGDYPAAVKPLEKAKSLAMLDRKQPPDELIVLLDDVYDFMGKVNFVTGSIDRAIAFRRDAVRNAPTSSNLFSLAMTLMQTPAKDDEAARTYREAYRANVNEVNLKLPLSKHRVFVESWDDFADSVEVLGDPESWSGPQAGQVYNFRESHLYGSDLRASFTEKQIIVSTITNVVMESSSGVLYTDSKAFFTSHVSPPSDYTGGTRANQHIIRIDHPCVSAVPANTQNWYHWLVEGLAMLLIGIHVFPDHHILLPDNAFARDAVLTFGLPEDRVVYYDSGARHRLDHGTKVYHFKILHRVDWRDVPGLGLSGHPGDHWRIVQPPARALLHVRHSVLSRVMEGHSSRSPNVVYISRKGNPRASRTVLNENRLIEAIRGRVGSHCLHVFEGTATLLEQATLFSKADIVISSHGAGLANLLFARQDPDLIYFPLSPAVDHCFGNIAAAVGAAVVVIPELSASWSGQYNATDAAIARVLASLDEVVQKRQWSKGDVCSDRMHVESGRAEL